VEGVEHRGRVNATDWARVILDSLAGADFEIAINLDENLTLEVIEELKRHGYTAAPSSRGHGLYCFTNQACSGPRL
jgi:hypothetical protein